VKLYSRIRLYNWQKSPGNLYYPAAKIIIVSLLGPN
jgi:hypothetical protein